MNIFEWLAKEREAQVKKTPAGKKAEAVRKVLKGHGITDDFTICEVKRFCASAKYTECQALHDAMIWRAKRSLRAAGILSEVQMKECYRAVMKHV